MVDARGRSWLVPEGQAPPGDGGLEAPEGVRSDYHPIAVAGRFQRGGRETRIAVFGDADFASNRHLRTLYRAGLVEDRRDGLWNYYSLRKPDDKAEHGVIKALRKLLASRPSAEALLADLNRWLKTKQNAPRCG